MLEEAQAGRVYARGTMAESMAMTSAGLDLAMARS